MPWTAKRDLSFAVGRQTWRKIAKSATELTPEINDAVRGGDPRRNLIQLKSLTTPSLPRHSAGTHLCTARRQEGRHDDHRGHDQRLSPVDQPRCLSLSLRRFDLRSDHRGHPGPFGPFRHGDGGDVSLHDGARDGHRLHPGRPCDRGAGRRADRDPVFDARHRAERGDAAGRPADARQGRGGYRRRVRRWPRVFWAPRSARLCWAF